MANRPAATVQGSTGPRGVRVGRLEAGLLEEFSRLSRPEGQKMRQSDPHATILLHLLQPGTVHSECTIRATAGPANAPRQLHYADDATSEADLVIGADGACSKVRRALFPGHTPNSSISFLVA